MNALRGWFRDAAEIDLFIPFAWLALAAVHLLSGDGFNSVWLCGNIAFAWFVVADLRISYVRSKRVRPNSVLVDTGAIEPSADIRQWASSVAQIRSALLTEGFTSEQASRQIADWLAAMGRES